MTRDEYNKHINLHIGALAESKEADAAAAHECHQTRRWEHTERIMIATACYVGNGLKDDIADRIKLDIRALFDDLERERVKRNGFRAFGRTLMRSEVVTMVFRTVFLALLTTIMVRGCGMTPAAANALVAGTATAQVEGTSR